MSGEYVIRHLLANNAPVIALVPAARIICGELPLNTTLPAISVTMISSVPLNMLRINEMPKTFTDRIQVTVVCKAGAVAGSGYSGVKAIQQLVLAACPSQRATVNTIVVDSIIPDFEYGPTYDNINLIYSASRDFFVRHT